MCYKMSLIEAPKLLSIKQKRKKEKSCRGWTDNFSTHCTCTLLSFSPIYFLTERYITINKN